MTRFSKKARKALALSFLAAAATGAQADATTEEIGNLLKKDYIRENNGDVKAASPGDAFKGLDPHSYYISPREHQDSIVKAHGGAARADFEIGKHPDGMLVSGLNLLSPAAKSGLRSGDIITSVDDGKKARPLAGLRIADALKLLYPNDTRTVSLAVKRKDAQGPVTIAITRDIEAHRPLLAKKIGDDIAYIRIKTFGHETVSDLLRDAIEMMKAEMGGKLRGFIVDLRGNLGGYVDQAIESADDFLSEGLIMSASSRNGEPIKYEGNKFDATGGKPVTLLIDGATASASEIVASALKDRKRATLIGTKTFGKGSIQDLVTLKDGGAARLTTSYYFSPGGYAIQIRGIEPDILVPGQIEWKREADSEGALPAPADLPGAAPRDDRPKQQCLHLKKSRKLKPGALANERGKLDVVLACAVEHMRGGKSRFTKIMPR